MNEILPRIDARGRRDGGQPSVVRVFNRTVSVGPSVAPRVKGGGGVPARVILADTKMQKGGLVRVVAAKPLAERLAESKPMPAVGKYAPAPVPKVEEEQPKAEEHPQEEVKEAMAEEQPLTETEENLTDLLEAAQDAKPLADAVETGVIIPELPESPNEEVKTDEVQPPEPSMQNMSRKKKRKKNRHNRYSMMEAEQGLL